MRILVCDTLHQAGLDLLRSKGHEIVQAKPKDTALSGVAAILVRSATKITADVVNAAPELRVVGRAGVGIDNVDVAACKARSVTVVNAPAAASNAVAELAMLHLLALARRYPEALAGMKRGEWGKGLMGTELRGRTLGLLGIGRIGGRLAELATGFGMKVVAHDPYVTAQRAREIRVDLLSNQEAVAAAADAISVHVPLTAETRGLINREFLARCKPGVLILNLSRGGIIDEAALLEALDKGQVGGAGLDVFETEPPGGTPLVHHPRVSVTPHLGASTQEAQKAAALDVVEDVLAVLEGREPRNRVA